MNANTPPIQLLPVFEAAARLLSFKAAADELCVTPSAVSQQIKTLENYLGVALFQRRSRQIFLTEAGQQYRDVATDTLNRFRQGHQSWLANQASPTVRISTTAQIAFDILIPALPSFQQAQPNIDLRIETTDKLTNFDQEAVDAAIRLGGGQWSKLQTRKLCDLSVCAVAAPALLAKHRFRSLEDIKAATLIHARSDVNDWALAGKVLGVDFSDAKQLYFENYHAALSATENSMGIALALLPLTQSRIDRGALAVLGAPPTAIDQGCYFVHPNKIEADSPLAAVEAWVHQTFSNLTTQQQDQAL